MFLPRVILGLASWICLLVSDLEFPLAAAACGFLTALLAAVSSHLVLALSWRLLFLLGFILLV